MDMKKVIIIGGAYMNFMEGKAAREHSRQDFLLENYLRLQELKTKYAPQNRFNRSYGISPAADQFRNEI
jgi:hypothetical protein